MVQLRWSKRKKSSSKTIFMCKHIHIYTYPRKTTEAMYGVEHLTQWKSNICFGFHVGLAFFANRGLVFIVTELGQQRC